MKISVRGKEYTVGNRYTIPAWVYDENNNRVDKRVRAKLECLMYYDGELYYDGIHLGYVFTWYTEFKGHTSVQRNTLPDALGIIDPETFRIIG